MDDHPLAPVEDADSLPGPTLPGGHLRRSRKRAIGPPDRGNRVRRDGVRGRRPRRAGCDGHRSRDHRRLLHGSPAGAPAGRGAPGARGRSSLHRSGLPRRWQTPHRAPRPSVDRAPRHRRGLGEVQQALLAARLPGLPRVLLLEVFIEPHSTKPTEDCVGWGWRRARRRSSPRGRHPVSTRRRCATWPSGCSARFWSSTARTTSHPVAARDCPRRAHRRAPCPARRVRSRAARARPGEGQPPAAGLRVSAAAVTAMGARPVATQAGAVHLLADRARARPARCRDRDRAAPAASRPRDRLARAEPRDAGARGARRANPSGQRSPRQRVGTHRE